MTSDTPTGGCFYIKWWRIVVCKNSEIRNGLTVISDKVGFKISGISFICKGTLPLDELSVLGASPSKKMFWSQFLRNPSGSYFRRCPCMPREYTAAIIRKRIAYCRAVLRRVASILVSASQGLPTIPISHDLVFSYRFSPNILHRSLPSHGVRGE